MEKRNIDQLVDSVIENSDLNNTRILTLENQTKIVSLDDRFKNTFKSMIERAGVKGDEVWVKELEKAFINRISLFYKRNKVREQQQKIEELQKKANGYNTLSSYKNLLEAQKKLLNSVEAFESGLKTAILRKMKENKIDYKENIEENKEKIKPEFEQYRLLYPHLSADGINLLKENEVYIKPEVLEKKLNSNNETEVKEAEGIIENALDVISTALHNGKNEIFQEKFLKNYNDDLSDLYAEFTQIAPWTVALGYGGEDFEDIEETLKELAKKGEELDKKGEKENPYHEYIEQYKEFKKNEKDLKELYKLLESRAKRDEGFWGDTLETLKVPLINLFGGVASTFETQKELLLSEELSVEEKNKLLKKLIKDNKAIIEKMNVLKQTLSVVEEEKDLDDGHEFMKTATKAMTALGVVLPRIGIISSGIMGTQEGGLTKGTLDVASYIPFAGNSVDFYRAYDGIFGDNVDSITGEKISFSEGMMYLGTGILGLTLDIVGTAFAVPTGGASLAATTAGKSGLKLAVKGLAKKVIDKVGTSSAKQVFIKASVEGTKATIERVVSKKAAKEYFKEMYEEKLLKSIGIIKDKGEKILNEIKNNRQEFFKKSMSKIGESIGKGLNIQWEGLKEFGEMLKFWKVGEDFKNLGNLLKMSAKGTINMFRGADIGSMKEIVDAKNIDLDDSVDNIASSLKEYSEKQFGTTWKTMKQELEVDDLENIKKLAKTLGVEEIDIKGQKELIENIGEELKKELTNDENLKKLAKAMKKNAKKIENYKIKYNLNNPVDDLLKNDIKLEDSKITKINDIKIDDDKTLGDFTQELLEKRTSLAEFTNELRLQKGTISKQDIDAYAKHKWNEYYNKKYGTTNTNYINFIELKKENFEKGKKIAKPEVLKERNKKLTKKSDLETNVKEKEKERLDNIDKLDDLGKKFEKELENFFSTINVSKEEKDLLIKKGLLDNDGKFKNIKNIKSFEDLEKELEKIKLILEKNYIKKEFIESFDISKEEKDLLKEKKLLDDDGNIIIDDLEVFKDKTKKIIKRAREIKKIEGQIEIISDPNLKKELKEILKDGKDNKTISEIIDDLNTKIVKNRDIKINELEEKIKKEKNKNNTESTEEPGKPKGKEQKSGTIKTLKKEIKELEKEKGIKINNPEINELEIPEYKKEIIDKKYIGNLENIDKEIKNINKSIIDSWDYINKIKKEIKEIEEKIEKLDKQLVLNDMENLLDKNNFKRIKLDDDDFEILSKMEVKDIRDKIEGPDEDFFKKDIEDGILDGNYDKVEDRFMAQFFENKYSNPEPKYIAKAPQYIEELKNIDDAKKLIPVYEEKIENALNADKLSPTELKELLENRKKLSALEFMAQNPELKEVLILQKKAADLKKAIKNNEPRLMVLEANRIARILNEKHITNDQLMAWIHNYGNGKGDGIVISSFLEDLKPFIEGTKKAAKIVKNVGETTASGVTAATSTVGDGISKTKKAWEATKTTAKVVSWPIRLVWNNKGWTVLLTTLAGGAYLVNKGNEAIEDGKEKLSEFTNIFGGGKKEEKPDSQVRKNGNQNLDDMAR